MKYRLNPIITANLFVDERISLNLAYKLAEEYFKQKKIDDVNLKGFSRKMRKIDTK